MDSGSAHGKVLIDLQCALRRRLFSHARDPWEGDSTALELDLIDFTKAWSSFAQPKLGQSIPVCPIDFSKAGQWAASERAAAIQEADIQFNTCIDLIGVGTEGWMPTDPYDSAWLRAQQLLKDTLEHAESDEERQQIQDHWIFSDFDEEEYS